MTLEKTGRKLLSQLFRVRLPATPFHRGLSYTHQGARVAWDELWRIVLYQPMFESRCARVGKDFRLSTRPDSRVPLLWNVSVHLGDGVEVSGRMTISGAKNAPKTPELHIGDFTYLGDRCTLRVGTAIHIGRHCRFAANVMLSGDPGHPLEAETRRTQAAPAASLGCIDVGDDVWMGYNVAVLGNVRIGAGSVIGAHAVVTRDIPPYSLVVGNPARVVRSLAQGGDAEARP
jgi:acetyltransferase-like isoleucine patch superfamily enzyme